MSQPTPQVVTTNTDNTYTDTNEVNTTLDTTNTSTNTDTGPIRTPKERHREQPYSRGQRKKRHGPGLTIDTQALKATQPGMAVPTLPPSVTPTLLRSRPASSYAMTPSPLLQLGEYPSLPPTTPTVRPHTRSERYTGIVKLGVASLLTSPQVSPVNSLGSSGSGGLQFTEEQLAEFGITSSGSSRQITPPEHPLPSPLLSQYSGHALSAMPAGQTFASGERYPSQNSSQTSAQSSAQSFVQYPAYPQYLADQYPSHPPQYPAQAGFQADEYPSQPDQYAFQTPQLLQPSPPDYPPTTPSPTESAVGPIRHQRGKPSIPPYKRHPKVTAAVNASFECKTKEEAAELEYQVHMAIALIQECRNPRTRVEGRFEPTELQSEMLERLYALQPHPTLEIKHLIAATFDVDVKKISTWFSNRKSKRREVSGIPGYINPTREEMAAVADEQRRFLHDDDVNLQLAPSFLLRFDTWTRAWGVDRVGGDRPLDYALGLRSSPPQLEVVTQHAETLYRLTMPIRTDLFSTQGNHTSTGRTAKPGQLAFRATLEPGAALFHRFEGTEWVPCADFTTSTNTALSHIEILGFEDDIHKLKNDVLKLICADVPQPAATPTQPRRRRPATASAASAPATQLQFADANHLNALRLTPQTPIETFYHDATFAFAPPMSDTSPLGTSAGRYNNNDNEIHNHDNHYTWSQVPRAGFYATDVTP